MYEIKPTSIEKDLVKTGKYSKLLGNNMEMNF
jgi:hypothetical protein